MQEASLYLHYDGALHYPISSIIVLCSLYENEGIRSDLMPWLDGLVEILEYQNIDVDILEIRHSPCHIFHLASMYLKWSYWPCIFFNNSFN